MSLTSVQNDRARNLAMFAAPHLWTHRPFLPVTRSVQEMCGFECGILYDARGSSGLYGYACTVFRTNLFSLPPTEAEFLALPRHVYDTFEEVLDDGWRVD